MNWHKSLLKRTHEMVDEVKDIFDNEIELIYPIAHNVPWIYVKLEIKGCISFEALSYINKQFREFTENNNGLFNGLDIHTFDNKTTIRVSLIEKMDLE